MAFLLCSNIECIKQDTSQVKSYFSHAAASGHLDLLKDFVKRNHNHYCGFDLDDAFVKACDNNQHKVMKWLTDTGLLIPYYCVLGGINHECIKAIKPHWNSLSDAYKVQLFYKACGVYGDEGLRIVEYMFPDVEHMFNFEIAIGVLMNRINLPLFNFLLSKTIISQATINKCFQYACEVRHVDFIKLLLTLKPTNVVLGPLRNWQPRSLEVMFLLIKAGARDYGCLCRFTPTSLFYVLNLDREGILRAGGKSLQDYVTKMNNVFDVMKQVIPIEPWIIDDIVTLYL